MFMARGTLSAVQHAALWIRRSCRHVYLWRRKNRQPDSAMQARSVALNASSTTPHFPNNLVSNTKYTLYSFLPRFLYEQFSSAMNLYFLMIACLQLWRAITPVNPITTWAPLILVTVISAIKEIFDDLRRAQADSVANQRMFLVYRDGKDAQPLQSSDIRPGDLVEVEDGVEVPCDLLLLKVEAVAAAGVAYLETANLDGETDLKTRQAKHDTQSLQMQQFLCAKGEIHCDPPNSDLYKFDAKLRLELPEDGAVPGPRHSRHHAHSDIAISSHQLLQHGAVLRKTGKAIGVAVYTGADTKLNQNRSPPPTKVAAVDRKINSFVVGIFAFQAILVTIYAICGYLYSGTGDATLWYLQWPTETVVAHGDHQDMINVVDVDDPTYADEWKMANHSLPSALPLIARAGLRGGVALVAREGLRGAGVSQPYVVQPWYTALILPLRFLLLSSMVVPISLKVSLDLIKLVYARLISADLTMYDEKSGTGANASNSSIAEDLGMVDCVLTDKTGTLTENIMVLSSVCVGMRHFSVENISDESHPATDNLVVSLAGGDARCLEFLKVLALCNAVTPEHVDLHRLPSDEVVRCVQYASSSPDEEALVHGASMFGLTLAHRHADEDGTNKATICMDAHRINLARGQPLGRHHPSPFPVLSEADMREKRVWFSDEHPHRTYAIVQVLEFTSSRKCMSVLLRRVDTGRDRDTQQSISAPPLEHELFGKGYAGVDSDELVLITKGADDIIFGKLLLLSDPVSVSNRRAVEDHIRRSSSRGLRTLMVAAKTVTREQYAKWLPLWEAAQREVNDRAMHVERTCALLEADLILLGSTAVQDRLQLGVPETIAGLRQAGIRLWMLTGDKAETAVQIAKSARIIERADSAADGIESTTVLTGRSIDHISTQLRRLTSWEPSADSLPSLHTGTEAGSARLLVVDGITTMSLLLEQLPKEFAAAARNVDVVLCCRCLPAQKAAIVRLVKTIYGRCLAIGDGGNDVAMIQAADVGVGISGREGKQAARAADFSIAEFRHLQPLILIHGRYSHYRTALISQYTFYKSMCICFVQMGFNLHCAFSGCSLLDTFSLTTYNLLYTFLPGLAMVLDRDRLQQDLLHHPAAYQDSRDGGWLDVRSMMQWALRALVQAVLVMAICSMAFVSVGGPWGSTADQTIHAYTVYTALVIIQLLTVLTELSRITWINILVCFGCLGLYILFVAVRDFMPWDSSSLGTMRALSMTGSSLFTMLFCVVVSVTPWVLRKAFVQPSPPPGLWDTIISICHSFSPPSSKPRERSSSDIDDEQEKLVSGALSHASPSMVQRNVKSTKLETV